MSDTTPKYNKQLFENSPLKALMLDDPAPTAAAGSSLLNGLFNRKDPNLAILSEKPEHRLLLYMKAEGLSNREIAQRSGYTEPWLSQLFRQPWATKRLVEILNQTGIETVAGLIRAAAADSVITLIALRDDTETPAAVRKACSTDILDRYLGKAVQPLMDVSDKDLERMSDADLERIAARSAQSN